MANGLFNLKQVIQAVQQGGWPAQKPPSVEYLVVAGGGSGAGGAGYAGGGGGAGGLLTGLDPVPNGQTLLVTVGAGGVGDPGTVNGTSGGNSIFAQISATGGGYGHYGQGGVAASGGSGGGAGGNGGFVGQGVLGQGNAGGLGSATTSLPAGGGGGAGTVGLNSVAYTGSYAGGGGAGVASAISGTVTAYAGGGGGSSSGGLGAGGIGGVGGGGTGGNASTSTNGTAGTANTGGGGGGSGNFSTRIGGNGGSGIVIVSYPDVYAAATTVNATASTSGSGGIALSGTLQSLSTPSNSGFAFGTGDFTIEAWVYTNTLSGERGFIQTSDVASGFSTSYTSGVIITIGSSPYPINANVGNTNVSSGTTYVATNTWYHVAVTRASGSVRLFINGALVGGPTTITANLTGTYAAVGGYFNNNFLWNGNISNLRVVKGTAVYTSAFTPSTVPLTAISGTSLLMNTVSGAQLADGSSNSLTLTPISGSTAPTWNALSPFTGTGYKNRVYTWTTSGSITF